MSVLNTYAISVGGSRFDNKPKIEAPTWPQITARFAKYKESRCTLETCASGEHAEPGKDGKPTCKHKDVGYWIPATFEKGRKQDDVKAVSFLVVDADHLHDQAALDDVLAKLTPYRYIAHATHSDRPSDRCARIFIPLSQPVGRADWKRFWVAAMISLGMPADPACCDAGRLYYWPSRPSDGEYWCVVHEGAPLDVVEIAKHAPAEAPTIADSLVIGDGGIVGAGKRHAMLISIAGALRARGAGETEILAALTIANGRCNPPKSETELRVVAKWASEQSIGERWATQPPADSDVTQDDADPWKAELAKALTDIRAKLAGNTKKRPPLFTDATALLAKTLPPAQWQITGLLTKGGQAVSTGEPKAAIKTWSAIECALAIATGTKAFGHFYAARGRAAIFFAEDHEQAVRNRIRALMAGADRKLEPGCLFTQPRGEFIDVLDDEDLAWVIASARQLGPIDLLVLDPLRDVHSGEEDKSDSMSKVMRRLRLLGELLGCTVWVSHHAPKQTKDTAKRRAGQNGRGSSAIHGATDSGFYIEPLDGDGTNVFKARVTSQVKAGRSSGVFDLELAIVDDDNGEAISAGWTYSRAEFRKGPSIEEKRHDKDADHEAKVIAFVAALAHQGHFLTRTELRDHPDRPIPYKQVIPTLDRLVADERLAMRTGKVCPLTGGNANA